ncbi:DNA-directed RNA polymerase subunit beta [Candidatus Berkelbacteria bacterium]|nr:DNA-directed RNA polymerase subunit beta [Candidatus Berkelbacteria bacterium]
MDRRAVATTPFQVPLPDLTEIQTSSYDWFFREGLRELLDEISPIEDFTGENYTLTLGEYSLGQPKITELTARERNLTYKAPVYCKVELENKVAKRTKRAEVYLGDFPVMTDRGTFVINGVERVVVSQIVRSYGVLFVSDQSADRQLFGAKIIPSRGAWLELETSSRDVISVKIDRKRKIPITTFLRAIGNLTTEQIRQALTDVNLDEEHQYIERTLERDPASNPEEALIEVYKRIRPGDLVTPETAKSFLETLLFTPKRYDLGRVGRYKMNQRLGLDHPETPEFRVLRLDDVLEVVREIIRLNTDPAAKPDDVDHLKNRRVRAVGELIQGRLRVGLLRMERIVKDRMSVADPATVTPASLINNRPVQAILQEFFASSQLSQFMNQTNPLAELEHKRTLNATGPGGLSRERAGFEVRDVHASHYGRICPIETPEGPNIGLVGYLASYGRINEYGFIETPYFKVITKGKRRVVSEEIVHLDASAEERVAIAPATSPLDQDRAFTQDRFLVRRGGKPVLEHVDQIDYVAVSPQQIAAISPSLIPFVENDDVVRALMGSNMQRQAVPLVRPQAPLVGTGMEESAARHSGSITIARRAGTVSAVDASEVVVDVKDGGKVMQDRYPLHKFIRSNQATAINQRPVVALGDRVTRDSILADGPATDHGELALGQNLLVAYMSYNGLNYEDAVVISDRLVREDRLTSIHIEKYAIEVRDTKLGPEVITRDIPNVGEDALSSLDEQGIVRVGAEVSAGDILVGKITPKGETELSAEEKLLRAIFGEKAKDVKDTSLRLPHGERGKVVDIKIFSKDAGDELSTGVYQVVEVSIAQLRKISVGDKLAGRHGNKGVIAAILPEAEMPYLPDGRPVDIILNPLGVVSRMNLGQILETHLGWAASTLGTRMVSPVFQGVKSQEVEALLRDAGLPPTGKIRLRDGRTGEVFDQETTVGYTYILKLIHLVDDKLHARSIGPYSMVTQQPLGGKAQFGGQRFGEMEVWALEAYGAAHTLQELLTIKSDDVVGRSKAYESIIRNEEIQKPSIPASFYVLIRELQSLGLDIELLAADGNRVDPSSNGRPPRGDAPALAPSAVPAKTEIAGETGEVEDEAVTEILAGQEKNPPKAEPDEVAPDA